MDLVLAWLAFPLVVLVLCAGWGRLLSLCAGSRPPCALLLPACFAAIVVVSGLVTAVSALARLATPLLVGGAVAGLAPAVAVAASAARRCLGRRRPRCSSSPPTQRRSSFPARRRTPAS